VLDHLVYAAPDLAEASARFAELTGLTPAPGGSHAGLGTANRLVGLGGGAYLEIIGPDPDQPTPAAPRPFGIDDLRAARIVTWAIRPPDLDAAVALARAAGYDPGGIRTMSRRTTDGELLEWRLTALDVARGDGLVPFLIDWGATPHPTSRPLPQTPLREWRATHPDPDSIAVVLTALGADLPIARADQPSLTAVVEGGHGPVQL
jgi:hypothetical protein